MNIIWLAQSSMANPYISKQCVTVLLAPHSNHSGSKPQTPHALDKCIFTVVFTLLPQPSNTSKLNHRLHLSDDDKSRWRFLPVGKKQETPLVALQNQFVSRKGSQYIFYWQHQPVFSAFARHQ